MKNAFGKKIYGKIGVDIGELAKQIAENIVEAGEKGRQEYREKQKLEQYTTQEELYCIARKYAWGYVVESLGTVAGVTPTGRGATLELAKCDIRFQTMRALVGCKAERTWEDARNRTNKMNVYVADTLDMTGSSTGKIQVGAGSK